MKTEKLLQALQQIATGEIVGESKNYKDSLYIVKEIAKEAIEDYNNLSLIKSGVELISEERKKQIYKHGFTAEHHASHPEWYNKGQLIEAAHTLSTKEINFKSCSVPLNWDVKWFNDLCNRPYEERLVIAGALFASQIDMIKFIEESV